MYKVMRVGRLRITVTPNPYSSTNGLPAIRCRPSRALATIHIGRLSGHSRAIHHSTTGGRAISGANRFAMTMNAEPTSCLFYAATAAVAAAHWGT